MRRGDRSLSALDRVSGRHYLPCMESMTVTQLRRRLASALDEVQAGRSYVITRHGVPIARLVPVLTSPPAVIPAKSPGGSQLSNGPRRRTYEEAEATLADARAED